MAQNDVDARVTPYANQTHIGYLDVAPNGRILSMDVAASQMIEPCPDSKDTASHSIFTLHPEPQYFEALKVANDITRPRPTVFKLDPTEDTRFHQANILPYQPKRIRIVLFREADIDRIVPPRLTARELAVLRLAANGMRRDRIAYALNVSVPTVDWHCRNFRKKLSASTTSAAVARALSVGLL